MNSQVFIQRAVSCTTKSQNKERVRIYSGKVTSFLQNNMCFIEILLTDWIELRNMIDNGEVTSWGRAVFKANR